MANADTGTPVAGVLRTDFVSVPAKDMERFSPHTAPLALRVADVTEARRALEQRGVQFTGEHGTGVCRMAFFNDSEGNALMLHRRYAA